MSPQLAAQVYAGLIAVVVAFQLALAAGAPLGRFAMGGTHPGAFPPSLRVAAVVQAALLAGAALVVLSRAGLLLPAWQPASRWLVWAVVALMAVAMVLNLITPSRGERLVWGPVGVVLFGTALWVALSR